MARRALAAGEWAVAEHPFVHTRTDGQQSSEPAAELTYELLRDPRRLAQYRALGLATNRAFARFADATLVRELMARTRRRPELVQSIYEGVVTNCNAILRDNAAIGYGIYPTIARSDHSCDPNCMLAPAAGGPLRMGLVATRRIDASEPLTWNYAQAQAGFLHLPVERRRHYLLDHLRFACTCSRCEGERPISHQSQRALVAAFDAAIERRVARLLSGLPK